MNKNSRILLTGVSGFIGSNILKLLHQKGYRSDPKRPEFRQKGHSFDQNGHNSDQKGHSSDQKKATVWTKSP